jgi:hypothetical protein
MRESSQFRARRERPHTFSCCSAGLLAALVFLLPAIVFSAAPPVPQPGPTETKATGIICVDSVSLIVVGGPAPQYEPWVVRGHVRLPAGDVEGELAYQDTFGNTHYADGPCAPDWEWSFVIAVPPGTVASIPLVFTSFPSREEVCGVVQIPPPAVGPPWE